MQMAMSKPPGTPVEHELAVNMMTIKLANGMDYGSSLRMGKVPVAPKSIRFSGLAVSSDLVPSRAVRSHSSRPSSCGRVFVKMYPLCSLI
ncbi:homoserine dehydrogenase [Anopheles sinensis]|uniref:Homoserine dehydrogenase n=1 Tax=Anopheles sinensis TaxID=74873 RepID=A0A084W8K5_ANOSI|nr:homoserine dehydrogenase [Anopheles sinensis]